MSDGAGSGREALAARLRAAGSVFAEEEAALLLEAAGGDPARLESLVARRAAGEPLEPLLGWVAFDGMRLAVGPGVFVPRRRTELVARLAAELAAAVTAGVPGEADAPLVLDLCCGVGAIGAAVARRVPTARLLASDLDPVAVGFARRNLPRDAIVVDGELSAAVPRSIRGRLDVIAVNAPYVPSAEIARMPPEARDHEPRASLDGGADGLDWHRRIAAEAAAWLGPGGAVVIEAAREQAPVSAELFAAAGFAARVVRDDGLDATAVLARLPG